jgi:MFS transporter, DHA1 family, solute carrier family 18 (vesicular amine transporter), member 1/2
MDLRSLLLGPPIGGALYPRFGFRAPFVFGIIAAVIDLIGRLLVIERKDALHYGFDPAAPSLSDCERVVAAKPASSPSLRDASVESTRPDGGEVSAVIDNTVEVARAGGSLHARNQTAASPSVKVSLPIVVSLLARSPRAVVAFFITGIYGWDRLVPGSGCRLTLFPALYSAARSQRCLSTYRQCGISDRLLWVLCF